MKKKIFTVVALSLLSASVMASNMGFLNETPAKYYSDHDWELLSAAQQKALDSAPDNTKVSWRNETGDNSGYFIPSKTTRQNGTTCRNLKIFMNADGLQTLVNFRYCRVNGEWKYTS